MSYVIEGSYKMQGGEKTTFTNLTLMRFLKLVAELEENGSHFSIDVNIEHFVE